MSQITDTGLPRSTSGCTYNDTPTWGIQVAEDSELSYVQPRNSSFYGTTVRASQNATTKPLIADSVLFHSALGDINKPIEKSWIHGLILEGAQGCEFSEYTQCCGSTYQPKKGVNTGVHCGTRKHTDDNTSPGQTPGGKLWTGTSANLEGNFYVPSKGRAKLASQSCEL
jgi:hypothetical protein